MKKRKRFIWVWAVLFVWVTAGVPAMAADRTADSKAETAQTAGTEYEEFRAEHIYLSDLPDEALSKPADVIKDLEDFTYALDYMAFYRVADKVFFEIDPAYAETFYNPYTEYHKAYLTADLADVYACQLDDTWYSKYGVVTPRMGALRPATPSSMR